MRGWFTVFLIIVLASPAAAGDFTKFRVGINGGYTTFAGGSPPWYTLDLSFGGKFGYNLSHKWGVDCIFSYFKIYNDSSAHNEFQFGSEKANRISAWNGYGLSLLFKYRIFPGYGRFGLNLGLGGGITDWKITDAESDETLLVEGERGGNVELATTEIVIGPMIGIEYHAHRHLAVSFDIRGDYYTGLGREFAGSVEDELSHWNFRFGVGVDYLFGNQVQRTISRKEIPKTGQTRIELPPIKEKKEIAFDIQDTKDSDGDGVPDARDDCPGTPSTAWGLVDIRGCPIDTDCDGFPNYVDSCPDNKIGARVDNHGCPVDSDDDGVPDGLDDCPYSDPESAVDESGCIDLSSLAQPIILNIKYHSGSFEIDHQTQQRLKEISKILIKAPGVKVEINGYTDNIGTADANKALSQKRANRVRDYLARLGISSNRLISIGRGETNFVASNDTQEGRQKNRRVELIFFK